MTNETTFGPLEAAPARARARPRTSRYLYVGIAVAITLVVFLGFTRTYWAPIASGTVKLHPAIHVHALLFFLWVALFLVQTVLPLRNRIATHRQLGLLGVALAGMMVFAGVVAAIVSLKSGIGPRPQIARAAAALSVGGMVLFSTFVAAGIANVLHPARHKRFMVLATFGIVQAAVARWIMLIPSIALPLRTMIGAVIVDSMLLAVILMDARAEKRIHPVYLLGAAVILLVQWARVAVLQTDQWVAFTNWLVQL